jgi:TolB-like protein/tetratricopeptide (TPR) repeat protein
MPDQTTPDEQLVRAELGRLLASPRFQRAPQLSQLLTFLVEETLADRGADLKEYVIGTRALGRSAGFDPEHDPIVRVQVRQLRARLAACYEDDGRAAELRIEIPKGSYTASFIRTAPSRRATRPGRVRRTWTALRLDRWHALSAAIGFTAGLTVWALVFAPPRRMPAVDVRSASVAVLPFANLTGSDTDEYFSDGLTDELIQALSKIDHLSVTARTSAFTFKGRSVDVRDVGRDLGVEHVVEGSVRRDASRVRIAVTLTRAADGATVWSETFDRDLRDALSLQADIAHRVAASLSVQVAARTASLPASPSASAQELYLRGRFLWNRRTAEALSMARGLFEQAIAREPGYAEAQAALAATYAVMEFNGVTPPGESAPAARAAAARALAIDADQTLALAVEAGFASAVDHDWPRSNQLFERAIALQPGDATARHWYGTNLVYLGRFDEGIRELQRAQQLDPLAMPIAYSLAEAYLYARRFDRVLDQANGMLAADPEYVGTYDLLARAHAMLGQWDDALQAAGRCTLAPVNRAIVLARAGRRGEAEAVARSLTGSELASRLPYAIAAVHAALGHVDEAFAWLERARASRQSDLVAVKVDPSFDSLRGDARFDALVAALNLGG